MVFYQIQPNALSIFYSMKHLTHQTGKCSRVKKDWSCTVLNSKNIPKEIPGKAVGLDAHLRTIMVNLLELAPG